MDLRHELKREISLSDMITVRQRLRVSAYPDPYAENGRYFVRSLYFDSVSDKALRDKINGVSRREKFRIRFYNGDTSFIRLEKKCKLSGLGCKLSAPLTAEQAGRLAAGDASAAADSDNPVLRELYTKMVCGELYPKTIVDYTREPFVYPAGNVRVTLDYGIRSGLVCTDFLNMDCVTVPVTDAVILEVKWDAFLPDVIRDAVSVGVGCEEAFSKYALCRIYG